MGEVHRGMDVGWGGVERPVAVKLIAPEFARHPDFVQTFIDEARLSYRLCHANVVQVRDIGQIRQSTGDTYFIAMEWVSGADLSTLLKKLASGPGQPMPARFAVLVAVEAARGLDYAHRLRDAGGNLLHLVHRDVSPTNLLLSFEGEVKVTDFGIARWRLREAVSLPGALKGKICYMAPEQARGEELDPRADVFGLGVVLYEMLTAHNPFSGGAQRPDTEVLERVREGRFRPPSEHVLLPQGLEAVVLRAMAPDRTQRYATCAAFLEDLEVFARREGWSMSPSQLGQFVRSVLEAPPPNPRDPAHADTVRNPELKRKTPTAPRPFDLALGAQLAQLVTEDADERRPLPSETLPGKVSAIVAKPRTVAMHEVIPAARPAPASPPTTGTTDLVPLKSRTGLWLVLGLMGLAAGGIVVVAVVNQRATQPVAIAAPIAAAPPAPAPAPLAPTPAPAPVRSQAAPVRPPRPVSQPAPPAHLSIITDVRANLYVDGKFVGESPIASLTLGAGKHVVKADGSQLGLHLVAKEETVTLSGGESRALRLELQ